MQRLRLTWQARKLNPSPWKRRTILASKRRFKMPNKMLCFVCFKDKCDDPKKCAAAARKINEQTERHNRWIRFTSGLSQAVAALRGE